MLIEKITGDSYEHQATIRVLRPAGMRHTSFPGGPDPRLHGPHHRGYQLLRDGRLVDATEWNVSDRWAAGDMISTTADLERLLRALFRGRIVPQPLLDREMFTLPKIEGATYSAGLQRFIGEDGTVVWGKSGARPGYATAIAATRDLSRTLVLFGQRDRGARRVEPDQRAHHSGRLSVGVVAVGGWGAVVRVRGRGWAPLKATSPADGGSPVRRRRATAPTSMSRL